MHDYKDLIEEIRAEFDELETGAATRLHGLFDRLLGDEAACEPAEATHGDLPTA